MTDDRSEDDKLAEEIRNANYAEQLKNNPFLDKILRDMEDEFIRGWRDSPPRDTLGREKIWQAYQIVGKVRTAIIDAIGSGRLAAEDAKNVTKFRQRQKVKTTGL